MTTLKIWKTHPNIIVPRYQTEQSACFDIAFQSAGKGQYKGFSHLNKPFTRLMQNAITIAPGDRVLVPTGYIMDISQGYSVRLHVRSSIALKQGLVLANGEGVIDSDYVDEVFVVLYNTTGNSVTIQNGDRVAQAELIKNLEFTVEETPLRPLNKTNRIGGFGSTGIKSTDNMVVINIDKPVIPDFVKESTNTPVAKRGRGRPRKDASK